MTWSEYIVSEEAKEHYDGKSAWDIKGISIRFSGDEDLEGFVFSDCDMSRFEGFTKRQFLSLGKIERGTGPRVMLDGTERVPECEACCLIYVMGMTPNQLISNLDRIGDSTPGFIEFTGEENFEGLDLSYRDFSHIRNLKVSQILQAEKVQGLKFGRAAACSSDNFEGRDLVDCDMSEVSGAVGEMFNGALCLDGAVLPSADFARYSFEGKRYYKTDFSRAKNVRWRQIELAEELTECLLPFIAMRRGDLAGFPNAMLPNLKGTDFSRVINLGEKEAAILGGLGAINVRTRTVAMANTLQTAEQENLSREAFVVEQIINPPRTGRKYRRQPGLQCLSYDIVRHCRKTGKDCRKMASLLRGMDTEMAKKSFNSMTGQISVDI